MSILIVALTLYHYMIILITSARLALLAGRQAAQVAFWALVRRTYYLVHTQSPGAKYPNLLSPSD